MILPAPTVLTFPTLGPRTVWLFAFTAFFAAFVTGTTTAQQRTSLDGIWEIRREQEPETSFQAVHVPGAFETVLGNDFDGIARYRRKLPLPEERTDRVYAEFDAVATHAQVFVNGHRVAEHLGGWTPFRADLTRHLKWNGEDTLEVRVDERVGHNTQGFLPIVQPHFGGIWQSVTLCCNQTPTLNRQDVLVFGNESGEVTVLASVVAGRGRVSGLRIELLAGKTVVASETRSDLNRFAGPLTIPSPELWRPGTPHLYTARLTLLVDDKPVDTIEHRFGCRGLHADGTRVVWNGSPLQVRGILHWGYSPPALAPPTDPHYWRSQIEYFRKLGFNTIKCCLWVPPRCFYELCDELGMLVWQEYPTWHPKMDQGHKRELLREYNEFFRFDRSHPSVAFRSITCETGHAADLDVVRTLFDACKTMVPDTLVVDDSSWIGWQRITDFWDEHPYGNNSWFPGRLKDFQKHIAEKGEKPLLLGECIAADTWVDRNAWLAAHGTQDLWWRPLCWDSQTKAEAWLTKQFGSETLASMAPTATAFAMRNRKFQIEQLRLRIPEAGYIVSVARDFTKARMGLLDDLDRPKFTDDQWRWHRDTMLCLDLDWDQRDVAENQGIVPIRISHYGNEPLKGELKIWCESTDIATTVPVNVAPGTTSEQFTIKVEGQNAGLHKLRIHAELTGSHPANNSWVLWHSPVHWHYQGFGEIIETHRLTPDLIDQMVAGARVLLHVDDTKDTLHSEAIWELKGAPFAPAHPIHRHLPRDLLTQESSFELASGRVMPWQPWLNQVDPILAFWETHDIENVRMHLLAFDTNVGKGRLLASSLNTSGALHSLRFHVNYQLQTHLAQGPKPQRSLSPATIAAIKAKMHEKTIDLPTWRFRMDPDDLGQKGNWQNPKLDVSSKDWRDLKAGSHWENQGEDLKHFTGVAWYRVDVDVPADWGGIEARCVLEGVDDSFHFWLNGELLGVFGDEASKTTIWLQPQVAELNQKLRAGERNTIVLRVVDHAGAGGLWKPVRLTTGPIGTSGKLLR
ncbi:MAG: hypothetical protein ACI89X_002734 [Planctomycetota bacterium]|jgi:hypothetical protein